MQVVFLRAFEKDLARLDPTIRQRLLKLIDQVAIANDISTLTNSRKLVGHAMAYRFRVGHYRVGVFVQHGTVEFARVLHRKDIYKVFP